MPNIRYIARHDFPNQPPTHPPINADYGLQLMHPTGSSLAVCGYNLVDNPGYGPVMEITHTPQGASPTHLSSKERHALVTSNFRDQLLEALTSTARDYGLSAVKIVSSLNHPKVYRNTKGQADMPESELATAGMISETRAVEIIDRLAEAHGFTLESDGNYWLRF